MKTALAYDEAEEFDIRRDVPIWAVPSMRRVLSAGFEVIHFYHWYAGKPESLYSFRVWHPQEGFYFGMLYKIREDARDHESMPALFWEGWPG